jgi:hypothetical protein
MDQHRPLAATSAVCVDYKAVVVVVVVAAAAAAAAVVVVTAATVAMATTAITQPSGLCYTYRQSATSSSWTRKPL